MLVCCPRARARARAVVAVPFADNEFASQRLAAKDLDDWEQKRVKRLPGENDGVL